MISSKSEPSSRVKHSRRFWNPSRSSLAAFLVNVTAAISFTNALPSETSATMRSISAVVFPEPAPASTKRLVSRSSWIRDRAELSASSVTFFSPGSVITQICVPGYHRESDQYLPTWHRYGTEITFSDHQEEILCTCSSKYRY